MAKVRVQRPKNTSVRKKSSKNTIAPESPAKLPAGAHLSIETIDAFNDTLDAFEAFDGALGHSDDESLNQLYVLIRPHMEALRRIHGEVITAFDRAVEEKNGGAA